MAKIPVAAPFTQGIGQILDGGGPPTYYRAAWFSGPGLGASAANIAGADIVGVAGPATLAYLQAQGFTVANNSPGIGLNLTPISGTTGTSATATVSGVSGVPNPTGSVAFYIDNTTGSPIATVRLANGQATTTITAGQFPSLGYHTVYAVYLGDRNYLQTSTGFAFDNQTAPGGAGALFTMNGIAFPGPAIVAPGNPITMVATLNFPGGATPNGALYFVRAIFVGPPAIVATGGPWVAQGGGTFTSSVTVTAGSGGVVSGAYAWQFQGDQYYTFLDGFTYGSYTLTVGGG